MKIKSLFIILFFIAFSFQSYAFKIVPDSTGMLGDNLDLHGILELFKNSEDTEDFEKAINSDKNQVNNLDLNNDGKVDYIKAIDYQKDNSRAIMLEVDVNENESQSVAVIELDKTGDESATVQIIGDEDLYGKDYIIEPIDEENKEIDGRANTTNNKTIVVVNSWHWKPFRYYYGPRYKVWVSPWRWNYYPVWYKPWKPYPWYIHHRHVVRYHPYCRRVAIHRAAHIRTVYYSHRKSSKVVHVHRTANHKVAPRKNDRNVNKQQNVDRQNRTKFDQTKTRTMPRDNNQRHGKSGKTRQKNDRGGARGSRR